LTLKGVSIGFLKVLGWILVVILTLVVILFVALQIPKVQTFAAQQGANYLSNTLNTRVEIEGFTTDFRNSIVLKGVYIEDQQQDTLWYSQRLGVDLNLFGLLRSEINLSSLVLSNATAHIYTTLPDSVSNYDFILEAFAADTTVATEPADTLNGSAWSIKVGIVTLEDIYLTMRDEVAGSDIRARIGSFVTKMDEMDLEESIYRIREIDLRDSYANIIQTKLPPEAEEEPEPLEMEIGVENINLENIRLNYENQVAAQRLAFEIGETSLRADNINLTEGRIDLQDLVMRESDFLYAQDKYTPKEERAIDPERTLKKVDESVEQSEGREIDWVVTLNSIDLQGLTVQVENLNVPRQERGMDFDHLHFQDIMVDVNDFYFSENLTTANIRQVQFLEQSGFRLENFTTDLTFDSTQVRLANLDLQTEHSRIRRHLALQYPSLEGIADNIGALVVEADIDNTVIGLRDLQYFQPDLLDNPSFRTIAATDLNVNGQITGPVRDLSLRNIRVSGLQGTEIRMGGNIRGLPEVERLQMNLVLNEFSTTRTDIQALAPPGTLPPDIRIPPSISMRGAFRGSMTNFDADATLTTTYGNVQADVRMRPRPGVHQASYVANFQVNNLDLGQILAQDTTFGQVTLQANVEGYGITPEHIHANLDANIQKFEYNRYQYNNILIRGEAEHDMFTGFASMNDDNLVFAFNGTVDMGPALPLYNFTLDLEQADLKALNLYGEPMQLQGRVVADMRGNDLSDLAGNVAIRDIEVAQAETTYRLDSLVVLLDNTPEHMEVHLQSDVIMANFTSQNNLEELPEAFNRYIDQYVRLPNADKRPAYELQDMAFDVRIVNTDFIQALVPELTLLETGPIEGSYTQATDQLVVDASLPRIIYNDIVLDSLSFRIRGDQEKLAYSLRLREVQNETLLMQGISLSGSAQDDNLNIRFAIEGDDPSSEVLALGGVMQRLEEAYRFSFLPEDVILNAQPWNVTEDNFFQFGDGQFYANNVRLERQGSSLAINSIGNLGDDGLPMEIAFNNFALGYIVNAVQREDSLLTGTLNGNFTLVDVTQNFTFTSDLLLKELTFQKVPVGDLSLVANNVTGNRYNLEIGLTGQGNQLTVQGYYLEQEVDNIINLNADIRPLNLASLEGFTAGMVRDMTGNATGRLAITGTLGAPQVRGNLYFDQATIRPTMLGSLFRLQDETITFNEQGIAFPNFTLTDEKNNQAVVTGQIFTETFTDYRFDLTVRTERFLAVNSTAQDNDLFYGTLILDSNTRITGDMDLPIIRANVTLLDGTALNIALLEEEPGVISREGIVEFVDMTNKQSGLIAESDTARTQLSGMDITATIAVTDGSSFTVIIDPVSGDNLVVRGNGKLNYGIDPSGHMSLSGRYELTEGSYQMTFYNLVRREFDIDPGSVITWTGDVMDALVDIRAIYNVRAAPMELINSQVMGAGQNDPRFRQQLPFQVVLGMQGELMQPEISFSIRLPEEERGSNSEVQSRLEMLEVDENERNKQAFALLVLGRFIAEDPLASSGGGLASSARGSASQVLSQQLNQLTDTYLGGLGLEVGVDSYEDYSTGSGQGRTELNVALQQQLLNDRLIVRVGGDFDIEGERRRQNNMSDFAGNVTLEYLITRDGRLRLKGFRRNDYEGFLEGDVQETGVGVIFMREYNSFADLFRSIEKQNGRRQ
jgi:translocation and assembly module TamB